MSTALEWFKAISTSVKDNKMVYLWAFGALTGWIGTTFQTISLDEKEAEKTTAIHEIAAGFQKVIAEMEPKVIKPVTVIKKDCSACKRYVIEHERHLHGEH